MPVSGLASLLPDCSWTIYVKHAAQKRDQEGTEESDLCKTIRSFSFFVSECELYHFYSAKCHRYAVDREEDINPIFLQAAQIYMIIVLKQWRKPVDVSGFCLWFNFLRMKWDTVTGAVTSVLSPVVLDRGWPCLFHSYFEHIGKYPYFHWKKTVKHNLFLNEAKKKKTNKGLNLIYTNVIKGLV